LSEWVAHKFAAKPIFPWVPPLGRTFAEVPAGYLLWCRCTAELHVLNDEYTRQWHLPMHINWRYNSAVAANVLTERLHNRQLPDHMSHLRNYNFTIRSLQSCDSYSLLFTLLCISVQLRSDKCSAKETFDFRQYEQTTQLLRAHQTFLVISHLTWAVHTLHLFNPLTPTVAIWVQASYVRPG